MLYSSGINFTLWIWRSTGLEYTEEDCYDAFSGQECLFLDEFSNQVLFERSDEVIRSHMRPLHIKVIVEGRLVNKVLIDGGAATSLFPETMFVKLGKEKEIWLRKIW